MSSRIIFSNIHPQLLYQKLIAPGELEPDFLERIGRYHSHSATFRMNVALNQLSSARPMLGHGDYRSPLKGLYMCGAGTHPGGGVTRIPGHNAAREIIKDRRWKRT